MSPDFSVGLEEALDAVLREGHISSDVVRRATDQELRHLLPLLLCARPPSDVIIALRDRVRFSRTLKLRLQLLRAHPAFNEIPCRRRFSSFAYERYGARQGRADVWKQSAEEANENESVFDDGSKEEALTFFVDTVDLQSESFFKDSVFRQIGKVQGMFGHEVVIHPFSEQEKEAVLSAIPLSPESEAPPEEDVERDVVHTGCVKQIQGMHMLTLSRLTPAAETLINEAALEAVGPQVVLHEDGDALRTVAMQMLLRVFNAAWGAPSRQFPDDAAAPFCVAVDVVPTAGGRRLECAVCKGAAIREFSFDYWRYTKGLNPVVADTLMRSAAGLYTAAFVCGLQDRNGEDVGVANGNAMYFRGMRGAFEVHTVGSAPHVTVPKQMRDAFRELGIWDAFRDTSVRAYAVLRERYADVFRVVFDLFRVAGVSKERILGQLQTRHSLNLGERDRVLVDAHFRRWLG